MRMIYGAGRGRRVLGRLGCRLGGRAQLHRLRAAAARLHQRDVRGQAGRHAGCRRVLAGVRAARGEGAVHRADRDARDQAAGPGRASCCARHDLSKLEALFLAGERCDPPTAIWAAELLGKPVVDHWWQTETGWADHRRVPRQYGLFPFKPGSGGRPCPGYDLHALDDEGHVLPRGPDRQPVRSACRCRPAARRRCGRTTRATAPPTSSDFPGWYRTGDAGMIDADGDVWVMGRTDDIINVAGHRLSTGAMEEVLASHPDVAECAVVGATDELKGQAPLGLVVLKAGVNRPDARSPRNWWRWCASGSGRWPRSRTRAWCRGCRRRAPARSCAPRSARIADGETPRGAADDRGSGGAGRDRRGAAGLSRFPGGAGRGHRGIPTEAVRCGRRFSCARAARAVSETHTGRR